MNISLLTEKERRSIELQRQASLLINNYKLNRINRAYIEREINKLDEVEQVEFREYLNKYKD